MLVLLAVGVGGVGVHDGVGAGCVCCVGVGFGDGLVVGGWGDGADVFDGGDGGGIGNDGVGAGVGVFVCGGVGGVRYTSRSRTWGGWTLWPRGWLPLATEGCAARWGSRTSTRSRWVECCVVVVCSWTWTWTWPWSCSCFLLLFLLVLLLLLLALGPDLGLGACPGLGLGRLGLGLGFVLSCNVLSGLVAFLSCSCPCSGYCGLLLFSYSYSCFSSSPMKRNGTDSRVFRETGQVWRQHSFEPGGVLPRQPGRGRGRDAGRMQPSR